MVTDGQRYVFPDRRRIRTTEIVVLFFVSEEENSIRADPSPEDSFPLFPLERLHISLKRIGGHLIQSTCESLLYFAW